MNASFSFCQASQGLSRTLFSTFSSSLLSSLQSLTQTPLYILTQPQHTSIAVLSLWEWGQRHLLPLWQGHGYPFASSPLRPLTLTTQLSARLWIAISAPPLASKTRTQATLPAASACTTPSLPARTQTIIPLPVRTQRVSFFSNIEDIYFRNASVHQYQKASHL